MKRCANCEFSSKGVSVAWRQKSIIGHETGKKPCVIIMISFAWNFHSVVQTSRTGTRVISRCSPASHKGHARPLATATVWRTDHDIKNQDRYTRCPLRCPCSNLTWFLWQVGAESAHANRWAHTHSHAQKALALEWMFSFYLQSSSVSWWALAFSGHMVTGGSILALAFLLASVTIGAHFTLGLTAPASISRSADTGSCDGVTQCSVLALTSVTAVRTPMVTVTSWGEDEGKESRFSLSCLTWHMSHVVICD